MVLQRIWVDQGQTVENLGSSDSMQCVVGAVSRLASASVADTQGSFWLVVRGMAQLDCKEGQFQLRIGDWFVLERDSRPTVLSTRDALVLVLTLPVAGSTLPEIFPGRGNADRRQRRLAFRHWRMSGVFHAVAPTVDDRSLLLRLLHFIGALQQDLAQFVSKCPGKSLRRKRQVFARMQRAKLYLDGNISRTVPLSELAQLSNFSTWYFTKTFHALYDEGPRDVTASFRLRQGADLLLATQLSIGEVSEACGFEHACSFARAFRAHFGMSATQFRRAHSDALTPIHAKRAAIPPKALLARRT